MRNAINKARRGLIAFFGAILAVCVCAFAAMTFTSVKATWMDGGNGISYYSDMTPDGEDLEYYETLYNADWEIFNGSNVSQGTLPDSWTIQDDVILKYTPSELNATSSFLWKFDYTVTAVGNNMNVYPLSAAPWDGTDLVEIGQYFTEAGKTYSVEFGSIKIKSDATKYWIFLKVDGEFKIGTYRTPKASANYSADDHRWFYFYLAGNHGEGVLDSVKPTPTDYDELANSDWEWWISSYNDAGKQGTLPDEWNIKSDSYLKFTPSAGNASKSFVWNFWYKPVVSGNVLIYPLAIGMWGGTGDNVIDLAHYNLAENTVYKIELKVIQSESDATKYHEYITIDGTVNDLGERTLAAAGSNGSDPTGLYIYLTAAETSGVVYSEDPVYHDVDEIDQTKLASYITLTNEDLSMPSSYVNRTGSYEYFWRYNGNENGAEAKLTSLSYKFNYTPAGTTYVALRDTKDGGWSGYHFVFAQGEFTYYVNGTAHTIENLIPDGVSAVELGAIDFADGSGTYIFVTVNGEVKVSKKTSLIASTDSGVAIWSAGASGKFEQLGASVTPSLLDGNYDVLGNGDFSWNYGGTEERGNLPSIWEFTGESYISFTPSAANTTNSFVWKAVYTPTGAGNNMNIVIPANGYWAYPLTAPTVFDIGNYFGEDDLNKEFDLEIGVIRLAGSETDCLAYVKLNGTYKVARTIGLNGDNKTVGGLFFYVGDQHGAGTFSEYPYAYTITDNDGAVLDQGTVNAGGTIVFNTSSLTDGTKVFAGFVYGGKLYKSLDEVISAKTSGDITVIAKTVDLSLTSGAYIKLVNGGKDASIKFNAYIDKADADDFVSDFGLILAGYYYTKDCTFTHAGLSGRENYFRDVKKSESMRYTENPENASEYYFSVYLNSVSLGNYGMEYAARAYVTVSYADGTTENIYTPFNEEDNVRSVYEVASLAIDDPTQAGNAEILKRYINGVIELDKNFDIAGKERDYDVSVSAVSGGYYTVTVTAKNGFDLTAIGAIYIAGEKIAVTEASLNSDKTVGTFKIAEENISALTIASFEESVKTLSSSTRKLEIFAYEGPKAGIRFDANGNASYAGGTATLAVLEEYMNAGFTHWSVSDASYGNMYIYLQGGGFTAKGTGISNIHYDVFWALDLAAEYAAKYKKACPVYVLIPAMVNYIDKDDLSAVNEQISAAYDELTSYIDANGGAYAPVNGKSQLAGFILKDEPTYGEYDSFAIVFNYLAYTKGAIAAGYGFECALLQTYTTADIGGDYSAYVAKYAELFKDTSISFDNYPCNYTPYVKGFLGIGSQKESWSMEQSWFSDMQTVRAQNNKIYGTCIQSYTSGQANSKSPYKRITCEADISMQVYTALAYGFTRLNYFTYWQRDTDLYYGAMSDKKTEVLQDTMIRWNDYSDWTKGYSYSDLYYWGVNANKKAIKLAEILMSFDSVGVQLIQGSSAQTDFTGASDTNTANAITASSTGALVVGGFKCGNYNGYLASNVTLPHDNFSATATFNFGTQYTKAIVYKDGVPTVQKISGGALTLNIASGDGLFIVPIEG